MATLDPSLKSLKDETLLARLLEFKQKSGYNTVQVCGQRKTGPPPFWIGPPPPTKGYEVFIGKLPKDVMEDELFWLFKSVGLVVYEIRMIVVLSGAHKSYAFAKYASKSDAQRAISELNGYEIRPGQRIGVVESIDNCTLYIGGLPRDKSKEEIYAEISKFTSGVLDVLVYNCFINKTNNRGFAFVKYESHQAAMLARKVLIPEYVKPFDRVVTVDWEVAALHVRFLPPHINKTHLQYLFAHQFHLSVELIQLSVEKKRGKEVVIQLESRHSAFIGYCLRSYAEVALNKLNGFNLGSSLIEVTWAEPICLPQEFREQMTTLRRSTKNQAGGLEINRPHNYYAFDPALNQNQHWAKSDFLNNPVKKLSEICQADGWGEPIYHVIHTSSSIDESTTAFTAKVYIPDLPLPMKYFSTSGTYFSHREAKNQAAAHVLTNLAFLNKFEMLSGGVPHHQNFLPDICNSTAKSIWNNHSTWNIHQPLGSGIQPPIDNEFELLSVGVSQHQNFLPDVCNSTAKSIWNNHSTWNIHQPLGSVMQSPIDNELKMSPGAVPYHQNLSPDICSSTAKSVWNNYSIWNIDQQLGSGIQSSLNSEFFNKGDNILNLLPLASSLVNIELQSKTSAQEEENFKLQPLN